MKRVTMRMLPFVFSKRHEGAATHEFIESAIRNILTERAGVVRHEVGLKARLAKLRDVEKRIGSSGVHQDIAVFHGQVDALDCWARR